MIGIVDYKAGNLTSVARALSFLKEPCVVTHDSKVLDRASHIIFPGVGAAGAAMANLRERGLDEQLRKWVQAKKPVLGICLGSQIILDRSEEDNAACLGIVPGTVKRFPLELQDGPQRLKIPHMGWNSVEFKKWHPVFAGIPRESEFYFVHSFYTAPADENCVAGWTDYGIRFCSAVARGSLVAVQFHPEKSGRPGLTLLANFCRWRGDYA
ncbi:MAG: imidazole glycerol phosphate synthase subunit HisH [Syntrophales bacterium]|jgi:glutamine amidotransferase|nr:imidazole glycerol phosphate synthase subunit HisH [Syntrophales bacterium]